MTFKSANLKRGQPAGISSTFTGGKVIEIQEPQLTFVILVARFCLGMVFLVSGVHKALWFSFAVKEFKQARLPKPGFFAFCTIILHIVAPLALIAGVLVFESALALALFTLLATIRVHDFWNKDGIEKLIASRVALSNLAIIGGLILLAVSGLPG